MRVITLVALLVWRGAGRACDLTAGGTRINPCGPRWHRRQWPFTSHLFFAVPHCYPLRKEASLFVRCRKCQSRLKKFICISGRTQRALGLTPYGEDVYRGPPADLGNKVFQRANIWMEVPTYLPPSSGAE